MYIIYTYTYTNTEFKQFMCRRSNQHKTKMFYTTGYRIFCATVLMLFSHCYYGAHIYAVAFTEAWVSQTWSE